MERILTLFLVVSLYSCSSSTLITVNDPQVRIFTDHNYIGKGSAPHSDTKIMSSTTLVTLKKEGCEDVVYSFSKNEEFDWGACIGGCFVLVPWLWIQKYKPTHTYEFQCTPVKK